MRMTQNNFSDNLFWDIEPTEFNMDKCPAQIIERVLEYGEWADWLSLCRYYGIDKIAQVCMTMRTLTPQALSFICLKSKTRKEDYRCYHIAQSNRTLWNS